jgi:hypothetical protein
MHRRNSAPHLAFWLAFAVLGAIGCQSSQDSPSAVEAAASLPVDTAALGPAAPVYSDPPYIDVNLSIDQAYAAIPHHRTIWQESDSTATPEEKAYLHVIFPLVDEAVALRVAAWQAYSRGDFDSFDLNAQYDRLITFVRSTRPPDSLQFFHQRVATAISSDHLFFRDWNSNRADFPYAQHVQTHPAVQTASRSAHYAYDALLRQFPHEPPANRQAFYDYFCALDFL